MPENFLDQLINYLGHDNTFVRSSAAAAIADAVVQYPRTIERTLSASKDYYREKV